MENLPGSISKKALFSLIFFSLLLLTLPPSLYLSQKQQVLKARAAECRQVCSSEQVCGNICRTCSGEHADDAGCDGDPNHPDICDGPEYCEARPGECHEECDSEPQQDNGASQPDQPQPENQGQSCEWKSSHNECTGCNLARSVEKYVCNGNGTGETRISGENVPDQGCASWCESGGGSPAENTCESKFLRNECTSCGLARRVEVDCHGDTSVTRENVQDSGCENADWCQSPSGGRPQDEGNTDQVVANTKTDSQCKSENGGTIYYCDLNECIAKEYVADGNSCTENFSKVDANNCPNKCAGNQISSKQIEENTQESQQSSENWLDQVASSVASTFSNPNEQCQIEFGPKQYYCDGTACIQKGSGFDGDSCADIFSRVANNFCPNNCANNSISSGFSDSNELSNQSTQADNQPEQTMASSPSTVSIQGQPRIDPSTLREGDKCYYTEECPDGGTRACHGLTINDEGLCGYNSTVRADCSECLNESYDVYADSAYCSDSSCKNGPGAACISDIDCAYTAPKPIIKAPVITSTIRRQTVVETPVNCFELISCEVEDRYLNGYAKSTYLRDEPGVPTTDLKIGCPSEQRVYAPSQCPPFAQPSQARVGYSGQLRIGTKITLQEIAQTACEYQQQSTEYRCSQGARCWNDDYADLSTNCEWVPKRQPSHCDPDPSCWTADDETRINAALADIAKNPSQREDQCPSIQYCLNSSERIIVNGCLSKEYAEVVPDPTCAEQITPKTSQQIASDIDSQNNLLDDRKKQDQVKKGQDENLLTLLGQGKDALGGLIGSGFSGLGSNVKECQNFIDKEGWGTALTTFSNNPCDAPTLDELSAKAGVAVFKGTQNVATALLEDQSLEDQQKRTLLENGSAECKSYATNFGLMAATKKEAGNPCFPDLPQQTDRQKLDSAINTANLSQDLNAGLNVYGIDLKASNAQGDVTAGGPGQSFSATLTRARVEEIAKGLSLDLDKYSDWTESQKYYFFEQVSRAEINAGKFVVEAVILPITSWENNEAAKDHCIEKLGAICTVDTQAPRSYLNLGTQDIQKTYDFLKTQKGFEEFTPPSATIMKNYIELIRVKNGSFFQNATDEAIANAINQKSPNGETVTEADVANIKRAFNSLGSASTLVKLDTEEGQYLVKAQNELDKAALVAVVSSAIDPIAPLVAVTKAGIVGGKFTVNAISKLSARYGGKAAEEIAQNALAAIAKHEAGDVALDAAEEAAVREVANALAAPDGDIVPIPPASVLDAGPTSVADEVGGSASLRIDTSDPEVKEAAREALASLEDGSNSLPLAAANADSVVVPDPDTLPVRPSQSLAETLSDTAEGAVLAAEDLVNDVGDAVDNLLGRGSAEDVVTNQADEALVAADQRITNPIIESNIDEALARGDDVEVIKGGDTDAISGQEVKDKLDGARRELDSGSEVANQPDVVEPAAAEPATPPLEEAAGKVDNVAQGAPAEAVVTPAEPRAPPAEQGIAAIPVVGPVVDAVSNTVADARDTIGGVIDDLSERVGLRPRDPVVPKAEVPLPDSIEKTVIESFSDSDLAPKFGNKIGEGVEATVYGDGQTATKVFTPTHVTPKVVREKDLLVTAEGVAGLPKFKGEIYDSNGRLVGYRMEQIIGDSIQFNGGLNVTTQERIEFLQGLADAYDKTGLIHGDLATKGTISPSNILVEEVKDSNGKVVSSRLRAVDYGGAARAGETEEAVGVVRMLFGGSVFYADDETKAIGRRLFDEINSGKSLREALEATGHSLPNEAVVQTPLLPAVEASRPVSPVQIVADSVRGVTNNIGEAIQGGVNSIRDSVADLRASITGVSRDALPVVSKKDQPGLANLSAQAKKDFQFFDKPEYTVKVGDETYTIADHYFSPKAGQQVVIPIRLSDGTVAMAYLSTSEKNFKWFVGTAPLPDGSVSWFIKSDSGKEIMDVPFALDAKLKEVLNSGLYKKEVQLQHTPEGFNNFLEKNFGFRYKKYGDAVQPDGISIADKFLLNHGVKAYTLEEGQSLSIASKIDFSKPTNIVYNEAQNTLDVYFRSSDVEARYTFNLSDLNANKLPNGETSLVDFTLRPLNEPNAAFEGAPSLGRYTAVEGGTQIEIDPGWQQIVNLVNSNTDLVDDITAYRNALTNGEFRYTGEDADEALNAIIRKHSPADADDLVVTTGEVNPSLSTTDAQIRIDPSEDIYPTRGQLADLRSKESPQPPCSLGFNLIPVAYAADGTPPCPFPNLSENPVIKAGQKTVNNGAEALDKISAGIKDGLDNLTGLFKPKELSPNAKMELVIPEGLSEYQIERIGQTYPEIKNAYPDRRVEVYSTLGSSAIIYRDTDNPQILYKVLDLKSSETDPNIFLRYHFYTEQEAKKLKLLSEVDLAPKFIEYVPGTLTDAERKLITEAERSKFARPVPIADQVILPKTTNVSKTPIIVMEAADTNTANFLRLAEDTAKKEAELDRVAARLDELGLAPADTELIVDKDGKLKFVDVGGMVSSDSVAAEGARSFEGQTNRQLLEERFDRIVNSIKDAGEVTPCTAIGFNLIPTAYAANGVAPCPFPNLSNNPVVATGQKAVNNAVKAWDGLLNLGKPKSTPVESYTNYIDDFLKRNTKAGEEGKEVSFGLFVDKDGNLIPLENYSELGSRGVIIETTPAPNGTLKLSGLKTAYGQVDDKLINDIHAALDQSVLFAKSKPNPLQAIQQKVKDNLNQIFKPDAAETKALKQLGVVQQAQESLIKGESTDILQNEWRQAVRFSSEDTLARYPATAQSNYSKGLQKEFDINNPDQVNYLQHVLQAKKDVLEAVKDGRIFDLDADGFEALHLKIYRDLTYKDPDSLNKARVFREAAVMQDGLGNILPYEIWDLANHYGDDTFLRFSKNPESSTSKFAWREDGVASVEDIPSSMAIILDGIDEAGRPLIAVKPDGSIVHLYADPDFRPQYFERMQGKLKELRSLGDKAPVEQKLEKIADYYQYCINAGFVEVSNQALCMTLVNGLLESQGLKAVEHGIFDFAAFSLQPDTFRKFFIDEVGRGGNPDVKVGSAFTPSKGPALVEEVVVPEVLPRVDAEVVLEPSITSPVSLNLNEYHQNQVQQILSQKKETGRDAYSLKRNDGFWGNDDSLLIDIHHTPEFRKPEAIKNVTHDNFREVMEKDQIYNYIVTDDGRILICKEIENCKHITMAGEVWDVQRAGEINSKGEVVQAHNGDIKNPDAKIVQSGEIKRTDINGKEELLIDLEYGTFSKYGQVAAWAPTDANLDRSEALLEGLLGQRPKAVTYVNPQKMALDPSSSLYQTLLAGDLLVAEGRAVAAKQAERAATGQKGILSRIQDVSENINLTREQAVQYIQKQTDSIVDSVTGIFERKTPIKKPTIAEAKSFEELFSVIQAEEGLQGSVKYYSPQELKDIIASVRDGSLDIQYITKTNGLRDKVQELLLKEDGKSGVGVSLGKPKVTELDNLQQQIRVKDYSAKYVDVVNVPRPIRSNPIDSEKAKAFVAAHPAGKAKEVAQAIVDNTRHVTQEEFEAQLKLGVEGFNQTLKPDEKYAIVMQQGKSNEWMAELGFPYLDRMPDQLYEAGEVVDASIKRYVFFDDGIYSGSQMSGYISTLLSQLRGLGVDMSQVQIDVIAPFVTTHAKSTVNQVLEIGNPHLYEGAVINFAPHQIMPTIPEQIKDPGILSVMSNMYGGALDSRTLTYFDHKIADQVSTLNNVLQYGYVLDESGNDLSKNTVFIPQTGAAYRQYEVERVVELIVEEMVDKGQEQYLVRNIPQVGSELADIIQFIKADKGDSIVGLSGGVYSAEINIVRDGGVIPLTLTRRISALQTGDEIVVTDNVYNLFTTRYEPGKEIRLVYNGDKLLEASMVYSK